MKKKSTGALSAKERAAQDARYDPGRLYDTVVVGSGISALTVGSLLAHAGQSVCMLEAHDRPGGFAHTFRMGDYQFCAQVHYVCALPVVQLYGRVSATVLTVALIGAMLFLPAILRVAEDWRPSKFFLKGLCR